MLQSPRSKKVAVVRDPDMTSVMQPTTSYNLYPFQGLQSPPKAARPNLTLSSSKSPPKRLKQIEKPTFTQTAAIQQNDTWYPLARPYSPLGTVSPSTVMQHIADEQHPHVKSHDLAQIEDWLLSFENEAQSFTSYFLFCELKFQQSAVLATGRDTPNRLRTAVAFYCLQQASSIFGRYQNVLDTICVNLGSAIYTGFSTLRRGRHLTALECYHAGLTYFEQVNTLQKENADLHSQITAVKESLVRLEEQLKHSESQYSYLRCNSVSTMHAVSAFTKLALASNDYNPAASMEEREKMGYILKTFKTLNESEQMQTLLSLMEILGANGDLLYNMVQALENSERTPLLDRLLEEKISAIKSEWHTEAAVRGIHQQSDDLNQYKLRFQKFQSLIQDVLGGVHISVLEIPAQDKETIEVLASLVEGLAQEKDKVKRYEARMFGMTAIHAKNKADVENNWMDKCHELESKLSEIENERCSLNQTIAGLQEAVEAERQAQATQLKITLDKETQIRPEDIQKHHPESNERKLAQPGYASLLGHKSFVGIYSLIQDANYSVANVKRILAKKRPLSLIELHQTIAGFYQTKMSQDIADDNMHRHREGLAQMLLDSYTVYYGLRELAMGQLITLDSAIRKHSAKSARIRLFGLLVGSLEPGSYASSAPAIDFMLFVVGILFNVGNYRMHEEKAQTSAKQLKSWFGDGITGSPNCTWINLDKLLQTIQLAFSYSHVTIEFMKDLCSTQNAQGEVELDIALEKIMYYWLKLYADQVMTMHSVFDIGDKDTNGVLDFQEFSDVVHHLDPNMSRRDCLDLYNKVAGSDNVIDKEEFVMGMIVYQRDIVLKSYFSTDSHPPVGTAPLTSAPSTQTTRPRPNVKADIPSQTPPVQLPFNPVRQLTMLISQYKADATTKDVLPDITDERAPQEPKVNWNLGIEALIDQFNSNKNPTDEEM